MVVPPVHADIDQLVGRMYKKSEVILDIKNPDSAIFARAYKHAFYVKKHGGPISTPPEASQG